MIGDSCYLLYQNDDDVDGLEMKGQIGIIHVIYRKKYVLIVLSKSMEKIKQTFFQ